MPSYIIRVTRDPDGATADFEVDANTWEEAKTRACNQARSSPDVFDDPDPVSYHVAQIDDDEEAARVEEEDDEHAAQCEAGLHSWVGQEGLLPPDTACKYCGELYGDPK